MQEAAGSVEQSINLQKQEESIEKEIAKKEDVSLDKTEDGKKNTELQSQNFQADEDETDSDSDADSETSNAEQARLERMNEFRENFDDENRAAFLESVLFLESEPQSSENLAKITQFSLDEVNAALDFLKQKYSEKNSGIELSQIIGGWILTPKKDYFMLVRERYGKRNEGRLSKAAIETLTIIAYSQPITRAEIQNLRHVNVDNMMRVLLDRKFIKEVGKKDIPGKPTMYGTTKEFLEFFHLQSIADLPRLDEKESEVFELAR